MTRYGGRLEEPTGCHPRVRPERLTVRLSNCCVPWSVAVSESVVVPGCSGIGSSIVGPLGRGWSMSLYPAAGEGGGAWLSGSGTLARPGAGGGADPERSALEAARRARGKIRRYCTANRLNRLGTLTYAGAGNHDPVLLRQHLAVFFRRLRAEAGGEPFPYLWVPEWHKTDHGLHAHFAVGRFIGRGKIDAAWGHGFVHIKLLGDLPVGSGKLAEARRAAMYLSKYAGKDFDRENLPGLHRYEVAQRFQPQAVKVTGRSLDEVLAAASQRMGARPSYVWQSQVADGWSGPPAVWASWD